MPTLVLLSSGPSRCKCQAARGVFALPANEVVAGAIDLEFDVDGRNQEVLNLRGVNVIRKFPNRGIRVWGARTLSSDPLWQYINVRRFFIFVEDSIGRAIQWVVFEPNDEHLWAAVKGIITVFLRTLWPRNNPSGASR